MALLLLLLQGFFRGVPGLFANESFLFLDEDDTVVGEDGCGGGGGSRDGESGEGNTFIRDFPDGDAPGDCE